MSGAMTSWWRRHRHRRVVLTHDGDFGTLALLGGRAAVGIIRVRPGHIQAHETIRVLNRLLDLDLAPSPAFLIVVQGGLARLHTWG